MAVITFKGRHFQHDMILIWSNNSSSLAVSEKRKELTLTN